MTTPGRPAELKRLEVPLALFGASLISAAFLFARTGIPGWIPPAAATRVGIASPLTGMTRSFVALASGRPGAAFRWHPLGPVVFVVCILAIAIGVASWRRGRRFAILRGAFARRWVWWAVAATFGLVWVRQIVWFRGGRL